MTYRAACETSTCEEFNGSTAKWFKLAQIGKKSDKSTWYCQDLSPLIYFPPFFPGRTTFRTHSERPTHLFDAPDASSSRDYLVRNEIIALHLAMTLGRAEYANPRWRLAIEPAQPTVLSQGYTVTITQPSTIQERPTFFLVHQFRLSRFACGHDRPTVDNRLVAIVHGFNGKPTSTSGSGGRPTAQSSLNRVCKLLMRDAAPPPASL